MDGVDRHDNNYTFCLSADIFSSLALGSDMIRNIYYQQPSLALLAVFSRNQTEKSNRGRTHISQHRGEDFRLVLYSELSVASKVSLFFFLFFFLDAGCCIQRALVWGWG